MKSALAVVLFRLFTIGVFIDGKESSNGELVSVTEGDSVTLKSGVTDIQTDDEIEWRFNGKIKIATISKHSSKISLWVKPDGSFRDRLQLDSQTGDLKISNIRTTDSGQYKPTFSSPGGSPPEMTFTVKVVSADAVKPISLLMGDSVTLRTGLTDLTDIQRYEIRWRIDNQNSPVAEINRKTGNVFTSYSSDKRFRDLLKLDNQTGSLNITNIRNTHSGLYEVDISTSSRYTLHKTFSVTVRADVESVSVMEGDSVTLRTGLTGIQGTDQIMWKFGDHGEIIAHLNGTVSQTWSNISLNLETRDLTIKNIQRDQYGNYKVEINTRRIIIHRKCNITIIDAVKSVSGKEGNSVTLQIDVTEIQKDDHILWTFGDIGLAEIYKTGNLQVYIYDGPDGIFRDRLELNNQTGSLNITNTRTTDSGLYELKISSSRCTITRRITVTVTATDINTAYIPHGTASSNNYSAVSYSGLSPAAVAGIAVAVCVLVAAAVVTAVVMYYRRKISELERQNVNGQNRTSNGTPDPDDHANEGTELTNASNVNSL